MRAVLLVLSLILLSASAGAQTFDPLTEYHKCLILAQTQPEEGWEEALAWQSLGGGEAARHCAAIALIKLGKYEEAATRLEALAQDSKRDEATRAEMLAQAGQSWLLARSIDRAEADQRLALGLMPGKPDLLLDHAVTLAEAHHYKEAADDLSEVLRRQPNRIEALALRASAYRYLNQTDGARSDIDRALELDPDYPDALLERGIQRRIRGDNAGAREDWLKIVQTVPKGTVLDEAQRNLELLDVKSK